MKYSEDLGLTGLAITPHISPLHKAGASTIQGASIEHLQQIREIMRKMDTNVKTYLGAEIDACRYKLDGSLFSENVDTLDFVTAATHYYPGTDYLVTDEIKMAVPEKRRFYFLWFKWAKNIINNPLVDVFAHLGRTLVRNNLIDSFDDKILCDFEILLEDCKKNNVAMEINERHLNKMTEKQFNTYIDVVRIAKEKGVKFCLGTDAHSLNQIGKYQYCKKIAQELQLDNYDYFNPGS